MSFLTNQTQESGFQQVGDLVTRNISVFCLLRVALYFKAMPNSIDFYKEMFLHVIPVRIIVPTIIVRIIVYNGESKWSLKARSDERKRSVKNCDCDKNEIAKHCWKADHNFSWDQKKVIHRERRLISGKIK